MFDLFFITNDDQIWMQLKAKFPHARRTVWSDTVLISCAKDSYTNMFWLVDPGAFDVIPCEFSYMPPVYDRQYAHLWNVVDQSDQLIANSAVKLIPKSLIQSHTYTDSDIFALNGNIKLMPHWTSSKIVYDIIYVNTPTTTSTNNLKNFQMLYPHAIIVDAATNIYAKCAAQSSTEMFWLITDNLVFDATWDFEFCPNAWDRQYVHVWPVTSTGDNSLLDVNDSCVKLMPRSIAANIDGDKFNIELLDVDVKIHNGVIAKLDKYELFYVVAPHAKTGKNIIEFTARYPHAIIVDAATNIYAKCAAQSSTEMFWLITDNLVFDATWDFEFTVNPYDRQYVHVWPVTSNNSLLDVNDSCVKLMPRSIAANIDGDKFNIELLDADVKISNYSIAKLDKYELFYVVAPHAKTGKNIIEFTARYPHAIIVDATDDIYAKCAAQSSTEMFWLITDNLVFDATWDFEFCPDAWDRQYVHVWPVTSNNSLLDVNDSCVKLMPCGVAANIDGDKFNIELFDVDVKIHNGVIAKLDKYELFYAVSNNTAYDNIITISTRYPHAIIVDATDDIYAKCAAQSSTEMFWLITDNLVFDATWDFEFTVNPYDQQYIHLFHVKDAISHSRIAVVDASVQLLPTQVASIISTKYLNLDQLAGAIHLHNVVVATCISQFDLFFVSYNEPNADKNYQRLLNRFPRAKRIHGITGIDNAHRECAKQSATEMFWTVDADTIIDDTWEFTYFPSHHDRQYIHVWYSRNPVNGLEYGYGAVKLWPTSNVLEYNGAWLDFTTSVGQLKLIDSVIATTEFNSSPFESWKSAFRETVKLLKNLHVNSADVDSKNRLKRWKLNKSDALYADWCITGCNDAEIWYHTMTDVSAINDFEWLTTVFTSKYRNID